MKVLRAAVCVLCAALLLGGCEPAGFGETAPVRSEQAFTTAAGAVTRTESEASGRAGQLLLRTYEDTVGCTVEMGRVLPRKATRRAQTAASYPLAGQNGVVRSYSAETGTWSIEALTDGMTLGKGMYFVRTDAAECIIVTPMTYMPRENSSIEYLPAADGGLSVRETEEGYALTLTVAPLPEGCFSDFLVLRSDAPLIDWTADRSFVRWSNYRFTDANRWCYDGYYYTSPENYYPTGENYFYAQPSPYIANKMMRNPDDPASRALGLAMLDITREKQNEYGFIPTLAGSEWLEQDYQIAAGFYDTRFNTDFWLANLYAAENFGVEGWLDRVLRYADFLMDFVTNNHYTFGAGAHEGWLAADYWSPNGAGGLTHSSLNHHAVEAVFLYQLAEATGEERYAAFADRMVRGIEAVGADWIMENGNLYYAYMPDGTMREGDYPYLTYNDLLDLQTLYTRRHGAENEVLARLMASKLAWIEANGVTGYNEAPFLLK